MNARTNGSPDLVDAAIAAAEQPQQPAGIDVGIPLPNGRVAHLVVPIPLTPVDLVQIFMALSDVVAGRVGEPSKSDDIRQRLGARGLALPT